ncbi:MAG: hypothetical protein KKH51_05260 [Actinobacteria bacterium]|nr:hypothetical protein [Actinomycetota bacterium]
MRSVYTYFVADTDAGSAYFRCAADSEPEAADRARRAGNREIVLYDVRVVDDGMRTAAVRERVHGNPFLGPRWLPLIEAIEVMTRELNNGFWSLQVLPSSDDDNATRPFVQASRNPSGSLQVEIGGRPLADRSDERRRSEFDFFGWRAPRPEENTPLSWQRLSPHWSGRAIAERVIESLVVLYEVDESALFVFGDSRSAEHVREARLLEQVDDELERVVALSGAVNTLPDEVEQDVAELIVEFADRSGIGMPYLPRALASGVIELFDDTYGSRTRPMHPDQGYFFAPLLESIYAGEWSPRVTFGLGGHGINSWALTYQLVLPGLAIVWQVHTGLLAPEGRTADRWRELTDATRRLVHVFRRHRTAVAEDGLLLVVHSDLREYSGVKLVTWDDLAGIPGPREGLGARGVSLDGDASVPEVFAAAEEWLRRRG